jgi:cytochrome P450
MRRSGLPTAGQRRARAANAHLHRLAAGILSAVWADFQRDAPLVRALMTATDPQTGRRLLDDDICHELVVFMLAGHDPHLNHADVPTMGVGSPSAPPGPSVC